eukprot:1185815-Prorocentrum_minimum.AAC.5
MQTVPDTAYIHTLLYLWMYTFHQPWGLDSYLQNALDDEAIKDCTEALGLTPGNVKALIRRALSYERKEKLKLSHAGERHDFPTVGF